MGGIQGELPVKSIHSLDPLACEAARPTGITAAEELGQLPYAQETDLRVALGGIQYRGGGTL